LIYFYWVSIGIKDEYILKLEEMLKEKLKATSVVFRGEKTYWIGKFVVDTPRKFFAFKKAVRNYGGQILRYRLTKRQQMPKESFQERSRNV
jgi:hypothetical protein